MLNKLPIDLSQMIYLEYYQNNVLLELKKIHKRYNSHYIDWSIFEHIKYVKSIKLFSMKNKRKLNYK